tara:strand:- start:61 stop:363 length:303 start_codon:yes stop_codon:yes gene_type:complete
MKNLKNKIQNRSQEYQPRLATNRPKGGLYVEVRGDDIMKAFRKLKKKIKNAGLMEELKDRQYYRKPSEIAREKRKKSLRLIRRMTAQREDDRLMGAKRRK